jgi:hypothetical protein
VTTERLREKILWGADQLTESMNVQALQSRFCFGADTEQGSNWQRIEKVSNLLLVHDE